MTPSTFRYWVHVFGCQISLRQCNLKDAHYHLHEAVSCAVRMARASTFTPTAAVAAADVNRNNNDLDEEADDNEEQEQDEDDDNDNDNDDATDSDTESGGSLTHVRILFLKAHYDMLRRKKSLQHAKRQLFAAQRMPHLQTPQYVST